MRVGAVVLAAGPVLLPEYRAPARGRFDLPSVALSVAAIVSVVYAVKHTAAEDPDTAAAAAATSDAHATRDMNERWVCIYFTTSSVRLAARIASTT